ncbi:MAG: hypothetical protein DRN49_01645 [Thaumarchaeota archaeon]|nr:MAG: hypothetical protein DRN49_01645 [Nitrososphaerota archaeon]
MVKIEIELSENDLKTLDRIAKALKTDRSGAIRYMLSHVDSWIQLFSKFRAGLLKNMVENTLKRLEDD